MRAWPRGRRGAFFSRWVLSGAAVLSLLVSGCYLSWPDRQADDARPQEVAVADSTVDRLATDTTGNECQSPEECSPRGLPDCLGTWECQDGRCVFLCENCEDLDFDNHGLGEGCAGPDCNDQDPVVYVGAPEKCDDQDNNCDGQIDEGLGILVCGAGICRVSKKACFAGEHQTCEPKVGTEEFCAGVIAVDENCDTKIDEFCPCSDGQTQSCYSGPADEPGVGECRPGTQTCKDLQWGGCDGEVTPVVEQCDGKDNDCDGQTDEELERPPCQLSQGVCLVARATVCGGAAGWELCTSVQYGTDYEQVESRCDGLDNDCDGAVDEGCPCAPDGWARLCGPAHGTCKQGTQQCSDGQWGMCVGSATAGAEICDGVDNDCDGQVDEGFDQDQDTYTSCGTKPGGGLDPALKDCNDLNAQHRPGAKEVCDGVDNDCDGLIDEAQLSTTSSMDGGVGFGDGGRDGGLPDGGVGEKELAYAACACNNGQDDDGDGLTDAADPGCSSLGDNYEKGVAACDDNRDNDGDGMIDYPLDPGCTGPGDTSERGPGACDDGLDNDGDGRADYRVDGIGDPGCTSAGDSTELGAGPCDDGVDNDGDGKIDYKNNGSGDPGCAEISDTSEVGTAVCDDGVDNDGDGKVDYKSDGSGDPGCDGLNDLSETGISACDDGVDNDGDGVLDFKSNGSGDPGCDSSVDVSERGVAECDDGLDNDGDGLADYRSDGTGDPGCLGPEDLSEWGTLECDDGLDNDGDGGIDYKVDGSGDNACMGPEHSSEYGNTACDDGADNDGDGLVDYRSDGTGDPGCIDLMDASEIGMGACDDGVDNDGDGLVDYKVNGSGDPGCQDAADASELGAAVCDDGLDNDGDGLADFKADGSGDPGCVDLSDPDELGTAVCDDGLDNDGDGTVDYKIDGSGDPGCLGLIDNDEWGTGACDDGIDNDGDGKVDFKTDGSGDPDCFSPVDASETCSAHAECPSGVCAMSGDCALEATVAYVDAATCMSGSRTGGRSDPFCTLDAALAGVQPLIWLGAGLYVERITITRNVEIYGAPGATVGDSDTNCSAFRIRNGARVVLSGLTIGTGANKQGGVNVDDTDSTLIMRDCEVGPSLCVGVDANSDTVINLVRNYIHDNQNGGVDLDNIKTYQIINNIVVRNGSSSTSFGGFRLQTQQLGLFSNNTVADNSSHGDNNNQSGGLVCIGTSGVPTIALVNSILWGNTINIGNSQQFSPSCVPTYCILQSPTTVPSTNYSANPSFIGGAATGAAYYHLQNTSFCIDQGTVTDAPIDDFDGELRDTLPDIGADEVQ